MDFLGSAAFSRAVQALDVKTGTLVCLKIIKVCHNLLNPSASSTSLHRCTLRPPLPLASLAPVGVSGGVVFFSPCIMLVHVSAQSRRNEEYDIGRETG